MMDGRPREVVSIRLDVLERLALRQLAQVMGFTRSGALRDCLVATMRRIMLEDPDWPIHRAWAGAGEDEWAIGLFQQWAWAITDEDPAAHFEKVRVDGVSGYRLKPGRPASNILDGWEKHISAHWDRQAANAEAALWSARRGDKQAKPPKKARASKRTKTSKRPAAN